ncbi:MAG TPA: LLM class F420-dependent oxidoreductase [Acidimicrobiia bacterium]|nr:LLM class F420-dependent oxidoreductase [Acidimicrobiia bacterium]
MRLGISTFPTEQSIDVRSLGRALEERGFESLFVPEHTHIPASRRTPNPGGGDIPEEFRHTPDPFVVLGAVAACTERLLLGTGICLVVERDPIVTAKEVATVDLLSGGRFLFGIGGGWNREEMENHGTRFASRFDLLRERVLAMKALWTEEVAEFHGTYVDFGPVWQWPKPVQSPHPPVILAGNGAKSIERAADYADGWMPIAGRGDTAEQIDALGKAAADRGRGPIPVTVFGARPKPEILAGYAEAGVERALLALPSGPTADTLRRLDRYAQLIDSLS